MLMMLGSYCSPIIAGDRDRPVSRIADSERPKSRGDYEREYRDKYRDKGESGP